jgi:hypothetical protein
MAAAGPDRLFKFLTFQQGRIDDVPIMVEGGWAMTGGHATRIAPLLPKVRVSP